MLMAVCLAGLILGVVLNSLADNLPPDELGARHAPRLPRCRYCGATHRPLYWLALVGFLVRGGRCEHCRAPRRLRHVVVELATALSLAYVWVWARGDVSRFLAAAVIVLIFILVAVIDIEHRLILRVVIVPAAVIVGVIGSLSPDRGPVKTLVGGAAGYGLVFAVFLLGQVFSLVVARLRGQPLDEIAFGGGDVNLAAVVGLAVGWSGVVLALLIAIFAAAAFGGLFMVVQWLRGRYNPYTPIPYGPFLILGALVMYFYGKEFAAWYAGR